MIKVSDINKKYPNFALQNISFELLGKRTALIGVNGAGKTTLINIILDLIIPDSGKISLMGGDHFDPKNRKEVGFLPGTFSFYPFYTVKDTLKLFASIKKCKWDSPFVSKMDLLKHAKERIVDLSKGERQRLGLAIAWMNDPKLLIMDEPFSGLDPILRKDLKDLIKNSDATFFISSHDLLDITEIADHFIMIHEGRIIKQGPMISNLEQFFYDLVK